jgi:hypothetical protein
MTTSATTGSSDLAADSGSPALATPVPGPLPGRGLRGSLRSMWSAVVAAVAVVAGMTPHVLHHVGLLAGTALVAGSGGTALFGVIGLVASIPMLLRLNRRFGSWWAPAIALAVFTGMFLLSTVLIGPAISGSGPSPALPDVTPTVQATDHASHHRMP